MTALYRLLHENVIKIANNFLMSKKLLESWPAICFFVFNVKQ